MPHNNTESAPSQPREPKQVSTLTRAFQILSLFLEPDSPLSNGDISAKTGLPKSSVSRLAQALCAQGYLEYLPRLRQYQLGPTVLMLGRAKLASLDVRTVAFPLMKKLSSSANMSVDICSPIGADILCLEYIRGPSTLSITQDIGSRMPMDVTASGRAALWVMDEKDRAKALEACAARRGDRWPEILERIKQSFKELDKHGFCIVDKEYRPEVMAIGCAFNDARKRTTYTFSCASFGSEKMKNEIYEEVGPNLVQLVNVVRLETGLS